MCNPQALTQRYLDVLNQHLGLPAQAPDDLDGDVTFEHDGLTHIVINNAPGDPEYLRVVLPLTLRTEYTNDAITATALTITQRFKLLKATPGDGRMLFSIDSVVAPPGAVPAHGILVAVLPRFLTTLSGAVEAMNDELDFHSLIQPLQSELNQSIPNA